MQRDTTLSTREEPDLGEINKGVEVLMRRETPHLMTEKNNWRKKMESALIVIGVFTGILTLSVGVIMGYLLRTYIQDDKSQAYTYHPEMFDENGNLIPDEIISFRNDTEGDTETED